jgi:hypothetical protein
VLRHTRGPVYLKIPWIEGYTTIAIQLPPKRIQLLPNKRYSARLLLKSNLDVACDIPERDKRESERRTPITRWTSLLYSSGEA